MTRSFEQICVKRSGPARRESAGPSDSRTLLLLCALLNHRMRRRQPRDWDSERRTTHIIQPHPIAELYALRIAAVFAADAALQVLARLPAQLDGHLDQLPHAAGRGALAA